MTNLVQRYFAEFLGTFILVAIIFIIKFCIRC